MTSPLGRSLPLDDWRSFHEDTILKQLFDVAHSPFNPDDRPLVLQSLENTTGLDRRSVEEICRDLAEHGFVELYPDASARLTDPGRKRVWQLLALQRTAAS